MGIPGDKNADLHRVVSRDRDEVGQIVFLLRIVGLETSKRGAQKTRFCHINAGVDLFDFFLSRTCVSCFDYGAHRAGRITNYSSVLPWVLQLEADKGERGIAAAMEFDERTQDIASQV